MGAGALATGSAHIHRVDLQTDTVLGQAQITPRGRKPLLKCTSICVVGRSPARSRSHWTNPNPGIGAGSVLPTLTSGGVALSMLPHLELWPSRQAAAKHLLEQGSATTWRRGKTTRRFLKQRGCVSHFKECSPMSFHLVNKQLVRSFINQPRWFPVIDDQNRNNKSRF